MINNIIDFAKEDIIKYNITIPNMEKNLQVEHFILDFTSYIIQNKLKQLRNNEFVVLVQFSDFDLANIMLQIIDIYYTEIEEFISLQKICDTLFLYVKKIEIGQATIYIIFMVIPFFS